MVEELTTEAILAMIEVESKRGIEGLPEVIRLGNLLKKQRADIEKAETDRLLKESEALAKDREKLESDVTKYLAKAPELLARMPGVKATGFTYHLDCEAKTPQGEMYHQVANSKLLVPTVKAKRTGGGGGTGISTKDETGMSLGELMASEYVTDGQRTEVQAAYDNAATNKGSAKWQAQVKVKKEVLKAHPELIRK